MANAKIVGLEGVTAAELQSEVSRGGKFVVFPYNISVIVISFRRSSDIYFIRAGENALAKGWQFALLSFLFGWWGFPWGLIWTPISLFQTLSGGKDVTREVMSSLMPVPQAPPFGGGGVMPPPVMAPPQNPWTPGQ